MKKEIYWRMSAAVFIISGIGFTYYISHYISQKKNFKHKQKNSSEKLKVPKNGTVTLLWPVVYAGAIGLAIYQALPQQKNNIQYKNAVPWLVVSYALNGIFGFFFSDNSKKNRFLAGITTLLHLPAALLLHRQIDMESQDVSDNERLLKKSVSIYAGWLTAASVVSAGNVLIESGIHEKSKSAVAWSIGILSGTGVLGALAAKKLKDPIHLAPLIVAMTSVALKQYNKKFPISIVAGAEGLALAVWMGKLWQENYQKVGQPSMMSFKKMVWEFSDN